MVRAALAKIGATDASSASLDGPAKEAVATVAAQLQVLSTAGGNFSSLALAAKTNLEKLESIVAGPKSDASVAAAQSVLEDYLTNEQKLGDYADTVCPS